MPTLLRDHRLKMIADLVRPDSRVADIGTDHGHLIAHLIASGKCPFAIAADIAEGPLDAARQNLMMVPSGSVCFVLCDGLSAIDPDGADDIIIAGMGGELIARILSDAPDFHRADKRFILQPMTRAATLREYLVTHGFAILAERPVIAADRAYTVMLCAFTGDVTEADPVFIHLGRIPLPPDEAGRKLLMKTRDQLLKKRRGIAQGDPRTAGETDAVLKAIDRALKGDDFHGT